MRLSSLAVMLAALLLATAALAGPADVSVRLRNGGEFEGAITAHDDDGFTLKRKLGGEFRLLWKDLEPASWVAAKRSLTDPGDAPGLLVLADRAADEGLRALAEELRRAVQRADGELDLLPLDRKIDTLRLTECEDLVERAKKHNEKGEYLQALGRFRDAKKLVPEHAWATNGIGEAFFHLRRLRESREFIEEAIRLDPTCKDAVFNEAYLDLLELDFQGCLEGLDRVLKIPVEPGKLATREEFAKKYKETESPPPRNQAFRLWVDTVLVQAADLRPIIAGVVSGPGWETEYVCETEHYRVMTDVSQAYADLMGERLELIYAEYDRQFSYSKTGERKTRGKKLVHPVLVFKERKDYVEWFTRVLRNPALAKQTGGVYVSLVKHLVFFQGKTFEDTQLVAWHEAFHQYLDHYIARAPHWFNEGQGEYFGASVLPEGKKRVVVGQTNSWRIGLLAQMVRKKRLPAAEVLMQRDAATFMGMARRDKRYAGEVQNNPNENYAASWSLVHFLIEGRRGRHEKKLLNYFRALADGMTHAESFEKAFSKVKWERFNEEWIEHIGWLIARAQAEQKGEEIPPMPR
jgi:tetratricopeptide (TPR) repeat protein